MRVVRLFVEDPGLFRRFVEFKQNQEVRRWLEDPAWKTKAGQLEPLIEEVKERMAVAATARKKAKTGAGAGAGDS